MNIADQQSRLDPSGGYTIGRPADFALIEHQALRAEIVYRLNASAEAEKISLLSTGAIYAFLISFNSEATSFKFIELLLWWAPYFALFFARTRMRHREFRLKQISAYLKIIEEYYYGANGILVAQGDQHSQRVLRGWERKLRGPQNAGDYVVSFVGRCFWFAILLASFSAAAVKSFVLLGLLDWQLNKLPQLPPLGVGWT